MNIFKFGGFIPFRPGAREDSNLKRRWNDFKARLGKVNFKRLERVKDPDLRAALTIERNAIVRDWQIMLGRRTHGELTDSSQIEVVTKIISDIAVLMGCKVDFRVAEVKYDGHNYTWYWCLRADALDTEPGFDSDVWNKMINRACDELQKFEFVELLEEHLGGECEAWEIFTQVWSGPS